ncbi:MAG: glycine zipper domain-containing protein [archaeon]
MKFNKKGIEAEVLVGIIITIIVASVIFWFLYIYNSRTTDFIDREACHQSVLMRSLPTIVGAPLRAGLPLKCRTEKILLTQDDENAIKSRIANAMHDCWWMLGEGKLNFFSAGLFKKNYCLICSTIKFDKDAKNLKINDFKEYLAVEKLPTSNITYLQYFSNLDSPEVVGTGEVIDTNEEYVVVFSFFKNELLSNWLAVGEGGWIGAKVGAVIGSIIPGPGTTIGAGVGLIIGGAIGGALQDKWKKIIADMFSGGKGSDYLASLYLVEYNPQDIREVGCTNIESIP